jgi:uncharacterized protein YdhG (YjbR/CyaY superfamily)
MKNEFTSVDEYMKSLPADSRPVLKQVREAISKALPRAEEVISYQIPAYKVDGRLVLYFAGWKKHFSIYPATRGLVKAFKKELAPYEVNNKGTVRFPLEGKVPKWLLARIAKFRAKEVKEAVAARKRRATS